jgi:deoxyribodipyrimidine photo-lyase
VERDRSVAGRLAAEGIEFADFKDQVVFDGDEVLTQAGKPFSVFTPYRNAWLGRLLDADLQPHVVAELAGKLAPKAAAEHLPTLADIGFTPAGLRIPAGMSGGQRLFENFQQRIDRYHEARDFPAVKGVSCLSTHLRFGTVSIRQLAGFAWRRGGTGANTWLSELVWRDFYQMILARRPDVVDHCFKPEFDALVWDEAPELFEAWCKARTGYPLIDAAMRQLNQTGYMHNRLRMIVASFLTKDLGIDWRLGERYFARQLLDYDLAANNGGWQWAASTGCDAQPWFRIFNPVTQSQKFDPDGRFIRRYLPELARVPDRHIHEPWRMDADQQRAAGVMIGADYPLPVVDHGQARQRTLARFGQCHERAR